MNKTVKALALITIGLVSHFVSPAQLHLPAINGIGGDLKKVIQDYPSQFTHLRGEAIYEGPQSTDYACTLSIKDAEDVKITQYSATRKNVSSWQATLLTTDDFAEARKKFKALYSQVNGLGVRMDDGSTYHLKGHYEDPAEERSFCSSVFSLQSAPESMEKMKVELTMVNELLEWKVKLLVYGRDREDDERGKRVDD